MHIGRTFYKNRSTVLEAFELVASERSDAYLVLVGRPDEALTAALSRSPYSGRVIILDRVSDADLALLYRMASVLLFPSLYEGFGYPVVEAQMCGTPVVCSDRGSLREVAGDGGILLSPHDARGFSDAILSILEDPLLAADLVKRGRVNVSRFSLAAWCEAHHALYSELVH
jgi:glycosyltransferase involved in cell wall biosynthesis